MESSKTRSNGVAMTPPYYRSLGMSHGKTPHGVCCEVFDAPLWTPPWRHYWWTFKA